MLRRVEWDLDEWPRVRNLVESLAWTRSRLSEQDPVLVDLDVERIDLMALEGSFDLGK